MNALQRLPKHEESAILDLVRQNGLDANQLKCEYTRQRGSGHTRKGHPISYDLMLCRLCGHLPEMATYCPFKLNALKTKMLEAT